MSAQACNCGKYDFFHVKEADCPWPLSDVDVRKKIRADTIAKVIAWLEREAMQIDPYRADRTAKFVRLLAKTLESRPEVLDEVKP